MTRFSFCSLTAIAFLLLVLVFQSTDASEVASSPPLILGSHGRPKGTSASSAARKPELEYQIADLRTRGFPILTLETILDKKLAASDFTVVQKLGAGGLGEVNKVELANPGDREVRQFAAKTANNYGKLLAEYARELEMNGDDPAQMRRWLEANGNLDQTGLKEQAHEVAAMKLLSGGPFLMKLWGSYETLVKKGDKNFLVKGQKTGTVVMPLCTAGDLLTWTTADDPTEDEALVPVVPPGRSPGPAPGGRRPSKAGGVPGGGRLVRRDDDDAEDGDGDKAEGGSGDEAPSGSDAPEAPAPVEAPAEEAPAPPRRPTPKKSGMAVTDANLAITFARLVLAVAYMHQRGYQHFDLKPANVMICKDQLPRIIDYGSTRLNTEASAEFARSWQLPPSTHQYVPKNPPRGQPLLGFSNDVYALGIILWQIYHKGVRYDDPSSTPEKRKFQHMLLMPPPDIERPGFRFTIDRHERGNRYKMVAHTPRFSTTGARPEMTLARKAAIEDLVNLLAVYGLNGRVQTPGALLHAVFTSSYILESGFPYFNSRGRTPVEKATEILTRINEEGIDAAASDNSLTGPDVENKGGRLQVWTGGKMPASAFASIVTNYTCPGKVHVMYLPSTAITGSCSESGGDGGAGFAE